MALGTGAPADYTLSLGRPNDRQARALYSRGVPAAEVVAAATARVDEHAVLRAAAPPPAERVAAALEHRRAQEAQDDEAHAWEDTAAVGRERTRRHGR
jgi:hypothetical protein